jgi:hypothetical protein
VAKFHLEHRESGNGIFRSNCNSQPAHLEEMFSVLCCENYETGGEAREIQVITKFCGFVCG